MKLFRQTLPRLQIQGWATVARAQLWDRPESVRTGCGQGLESACVKKKGVSWDL